MSWKDQLIYTAYNMAIQRTRNKSRISITGQWGHLSKRAKV